MNHLLKKILEECGINHSQFSKDMGISRPYAVALLNGSKPFTDSIYKKLLSLEYITDKDCDDLTNEYFKIKYGANQLKKVKYFLSLGKSFTFEPLADIPNQLPQNDAPVRFLDKEGIIGTAVRLLHNAVHNHSTFYTNYAYSLSELDEKLYAYYKSIYIYSDPQDTIDHLITLPDRVENISILSYWQCLKWGALRKTTYVSVSPYQKQIMPYYIVCGDEVLLFSDDLSAGTLLRCEETAQYYISCHLSTKKKARPTITIIHDESELLTGQDFVQPKYIKSLSTYISAMNFLDYDMLYRTTTENPEYIKDMLIKAYINYYSHTKKLGRLSVYYTHDTLTNFMKTGLLYNVSEKYLHEFSVEDRIKAIDNVICDSNYCIMKKEVADFYRGYDASSTDKSAITHFVLIPSWCKDYEIYMCISKNKYRDLNDFTSALFAYIENGHVFTREESDFELRQLQSTKGLPDEIVG